MFKSVFSRRKTTELPSVEDFEDYIQHLTKAQDHVIAALNALYGPSRVKRGWMYRVYLFGAQNRLMILLMKEQNAISQQHTRVRDDTDQFDRDRDIARWNGHMWWPASKRALSDYPTLHDLAMSKQTIGPNGPSPTTTPFRKPEEGEKF